MKEIYGFVESIGYLKKKFNDYTVAELPKLVTQIEIIANKESDKRRKNFKVTKGKDEE